MELKKIFKKKKEIEKEVENTASDDYRKIAEAILIRFGVNNPSQLSDEKILEEFSKIPHPNTTFDSNSGLFPSGDISESSPLSKVDGIIMASWFAPDFVKAIIPDREFLEIWKRERNKKTDSEVSVSDVSSDKILNLLLEMKTDFIKEINEEDKNIKVLDVIMLLKELDKKYTEFIRNTYKIEVPSFLNILNTFVTISGISDISDFIALSEQKIENGEKITYTKINEEPLSLEDIINQFEAEEEEEDEGWDEEEEDDDFDDLDLDDEDE